MKKIVEVILVAITCTLLACHGAKKEYNQDTTATSGTVPTDNTGTYQNSSGKGNPHADTTMLDTSADNK